jgi:hypothetical protein
MFSRDSSALVCKIFNSSSIFQFISNRRRIGRPDFWNKARVASIAEPARQKSRERFSREQKQRRPGRDAFVISAADCRRLSAEQHRHQGHTTNIR